MGQQIVYIPGIKLSVGYTCDTDDEEENIGIYSIDTWVEIWRKKLEKYKRPKILGKILRRKYREIFYWPMKGNIGRNIEKYS